MLTVTLANEAANLQHAGLAYTNGNNCSANDGACFGNRLPGDVSYALLQEQGRPARAQSAGVNGTRRVRFVS